jgi:hypothetical protein
MYKVGRLPEDAAIARDAELRVTLRTDEWVGDAALLADITPVEVSPNSGSDAGAADLPCRQRWRSV